MFNSYFFILFFLPLFVIGYFASNKVNAGTGKLFLVLASSVIYIYWAGMASVVFVVSIALNLVLLYAVEKAEKRKKWFLVAAVVINIGLLFYYKYFGFAINIVNVALNKAFIAKELILPVGISFFTFQQIMYVVSVYRGEIKYVSIVEYLAYILYFPKLIMGPLARPDNFVKQLNDSSLKTARWDNIAGGLKIFSYGLLKKMLLADTFFRAVSWGFDNIEKATSGDLFLVMLCYTFEIYFDFSGYMDMAIGISNMVNITLPMNFDSPYKALSVRDFWKRWHMSLTNFLTEYVYFPLGGSKKGRVRTYANIMIVFLISGLWHGARWTFVLWGGIHGLLQIMERIFDKTFHKLSDIVKWGYTFLAVNLLWLLFRAETIAQWRKLLKRMFAFQNMTISEGLINSFSLPETEYLRLVFGLSCSNSFSMLIFIISAYLICLIPHNNYQTINKISFINMFLSAVAFVWAFLCLGSEIVYIYSGF